MGDGLVERMNRPLLTLLRSYTEREGDWEEDLQLLLCVYQSTRHATTGYHHTKFSLGLTLPSYMFPDYQEQQCQSPWNTARALEPKFRS